MKKNLLVLLVCLAGMMILAGCGSKPSSSEVVSPITDSTQQELLEKTGVNLQAPKEASDVQYFLYDIKDEKGNQNLIANMRFTLEGKAVDVRGQKSDLKNADFDLTAGKASVEKPLGDISGLFYSWDSMAAQDVGSCNAITYRKDDAGFIAWVDENCGVLYNVSMTEGATDAVLTEMANKVFIPAN